jgi:hypothetical protein
LENVTKCQIPYILALQNLSPVQPSGVLKAQVHGPACDHYNWNIEFISVIDVPICAWPAQISHNREVCGKQMRGLWGIGDKGSGLTFRENRPTMDR